MPSLDTLPVELVLKILSGASLEDIFNVTRTSTYFRAIGCSSRSLWADAHDAANRLPLPMGKTLETVSLLSISRLAAHAVQTSTVWRRTVAHPRKVSYTIPYSPRPPRVSRIFPPYDMFPLVYSIILPGNQWLLGDMHTDAPHLYCLATGESFPLEVQGTVHGYAYESVNNGSSIVLAVVKGDSIWVASGWFLEVYILQFDSQDHYRTVPHVKKVFSVYMKTWVYIRPHIDLKGPNVVISAGSTLFIANWKENIGIKLSPPQYLSYQAGQTEDNSSWKFHLKAYFHPELPLIIAERVRFQHGRISIHVVRFPVELYPFERTNIPEKNIVWPTELFTSTIIHTIEKDKQEIVYRSFHRCSEKGLVLNLVYHDTRLPRSVDWHLSISNLGGLTPETASHRVGFKRHLIERYTSGCRTVCLGLHPSEHPFPSPSSCGLYTTPPNPQGNSATSWIQKRVAKFKFSPTGNSKRPISPRNDPDSLFVLRRPERFGQEPTWLRLELPSGFILQGIFSEISVLSFNDVYGTLLLDDQKGNYFVVQY